MTKTVNPELIKALRECYEDLAAPVDVCKQFGLQYPGPTIKVGFLADSQFAENLPVKGSDFWKNPDRAVVTIFNTHKDPDQDALNLFAFFIYEPKKTEETLSVDLLGILSKHYKAIFKRLPVPIFHNLCDRLQSYGLLDLFEKSLNKENIDYKASLPKDLSRKLEQWKNLPKNRALFHPQASEQHPESIEPAPAPEPAPPAPLDIDSIIAAKQKFFDETPTAYIMESFFERDGTTAKNLGSHTNTILGDVDPLSSSFIKSFLRKISQHNMPSDLKRPASLMFVLGLYDDYAKGVIDNDQLSRCSQENLSNVWVYSLSNPDHYSFIFESARRLDYLPDLYFIMNSQRSAARPEHLEKLKDWCTSKNIDLTQMLVDYELPPLPENIAPELADPRDAIIAKTQAWFDETPMYELQAILAYSINPSMFDEGATNSFTADFKEASEHVHSSHMPDKFISEFFRHVERMERSFKEKSILILSRIMFTSIQDSAALEEEPQIKGHLGVHIVTNREYAPKEAKNRIRGAAQRIAADAFSNLNIERIILNAVISDKNKRNYIFDQTHKYGLLPHLYFLANAQDTNFPPATTKHLNDWCASKGIDLKQMLADFEIPVLPEDTLELEEDLSAEPEAPDAAEEFEKATFIPDPDIYGDDVEIIDVPGLLVEAGQGNMPAHDAPSSDKPSPSRKHQPRIQWLVDGLRPHAALERGSIKVFRPVNWAEHGPYGDNAHRIIQIKDKSGQIHHIGVNNYYGGGTYVIKPVVPITAEEFEPLKIPALLGAHFKENIRPDDIRAWPIHCYEGKPQKYADDAWKICNTPLADLAPYIPRIGWTNKCNEAQDLCRQHMIKTGQRVKTNDRTPVMIDYTEEGPLYTTIGRLACAIRDGAIGGAGLRNMDKLPKDLSDADKKDVPTDNMNLFYTQLFMKFPGLCEHDKNPAIHAKFVFGDVAAVTRETGIVPQRDLFGGIVIAGIPAQKIDGFFNGIGGRIVGIGSVVSVDDNKPSSLDDFSIAAGIGIRDEGMVHPNWEHPALVGSQHAPRGHQ